VSALACKVLNLGKLSTPENMRDAYNLMDIMVVPSKVESFGQVAAESLACQTPVVAFDHSGTTDIVSHMKSGYLAKPFDARDLANGIMTLIDMDKCERNKYGEEGRQHIISNFSNDVIAKKYIELITK
jgi:glycosyltransferase involved in cell wall biosynthesis